MDNTEILKSYNFISETFKKANIFSWWVQNAYQPYSGAKEVLKELDCVAREAEMFIENKKELEKKVYNICHLAESDWRGKSQKNLNKKEQEIERKIFSFFAELMAFSDLANNGFTEIEFMAETKEPTPDMFAKKNDEIYYIEVKRIQRPRKEDINFRESGESNGEINVNYQEPLKKKIVDFICSAKNKFKSVENNNNLKKYQKILILDFVLGSDIILQKSFKANLISIFGKNYFDNLENAYDMTIIPKKYF